SSPPFKGDRWRDVPSCRWTVPFGGVPYIAHRQQRLLVEYSTLQCIWDADLFGSWPVTRASPAMGQVLSRLCALPELFAFPSYQIRGPDFFPLSCRDSRRNSTIVFSCPKIRQGLINA